MMIILQPMIFFMVTALKTCAYFLHLAASAITRVYNSSGHLHLAVKIFLIRQFVLQATSEPILQYKYPILTRTPCCSSCCSRNLLFKAIACYYLVVTSKWFCYYHVRVLFVTCALSLR